MILLTARGFDNLMRLGETAHTSPPAPLHSVERGVRGGGRGEVPGTIALAHPPRFGVPTVISLALLAGLIGYNLTYYLPGQLRLYHGYNYVSGIKVDAVEAAGVHHAVVFANVGKPYEWWEYGEVFSANDPLLQGDVIYARDLGEVEDRKLLTDFPGRTYYRLDGAKLTSLQ
jgi:hypothetical protein